ncbi:related to LYS2 - L-aminoadipate-semialdehyde dehydrogenase, large subunit [Melanopsichium pennsylvanicum]|uniref:Related to LYS2 - L-aminoadipate-semialdehyde dehydrogenase, large subunit n=2 Tax=Melanopsichium pennsylvanicum TaxID=63383 RepID=A0AAJ4XLX0_9BASI|nr:related to LYS2-L-aminoadipate-semialdehyde dehydrogenase, large subunit [Melanopsichium pennsylvanicum 4]SNX84351.1 related to LYS2 - L-aminoadipate-semialdehyde dehydrogenase, large subunit [Melanopsichium pennsylvanicum]
MATSISPDNPPYLTLTISQALSLDRPSHPEPAHHESVNSMLDQRAEHLGPQVAVGFTYLDATSSKWLCHALTYGQIRTLSLNLASELKASLPGKQKNVKSPNGTPLVAVLSPSGMELFGHIVALWRLGWGVLCIAPGSPVEAIGNLLNLTETNVVLAHESQANAARVAVAAIDGKAQVCQMLPDVLRYTQGKGNGKNRTDLEENIVGGEDVLVTMHTSGSSGLPKPIYQLHRFWTASLISAPGTSSSAFTTTPLFHGGMSDMLRSMQAGSTIYFHPSADPGALSTIAICNAIAACNETISYFLSVPYILDMLFLDRSDEGRTMLKRMELVSTGGAPLPQQLGDDMVEQGVKLVSRLGSSECGFLMSSWRPFTTDKEWNFLRIPDSLGQNLIRFEPHSSDLYELIVTSKWPAKLVVNRTDGSYATSDLYSKHSTLPNTWRYDSRADDTLVLVNGKKVSPILAEGKLKGMDLVTEAIVFGANRAILGALVFVSAETLSNEEDFDDKLKVKLLQKVQPILKDINAASPPHAQLATDMVHLLPPSELSSIPRASKGTLQRGRAYQHYSSLIDSVYLDFEEGRSLRLTHPNSTGGKENLSGKYLMAWLGDKVESINGRKVDPDTDLFVAGVDSIQSARIRAAIHQNVELGPGKLLERNVVYEYPTLKLLCRHIEEVKAGNKMGDGAGEERQQRELKLMRDLVEKYTRASPFEPLRSLLTSKNAVKDPDSDAKKKTLYVLTGVTGGLGAQILNQVLNQSLPDDTVLCLVRAKSMSHAQQRVLDSLESRKLARSYFIVQAKGGPVSCLAADFSRSDCGISVETISPLAKHQRVVTIHSAWSVNFVAGLSSFEAENIAGLSHLIDLHQQLSTLCSDSRTSCFTFCSSVASILSPNSTLNVNNVLGEHLSREPQDAVEMGYARSKWVAEQIVARRGERSKNSQSRYSIVRIGQLTADTQEGVWNENEAWPILISISCDLGVFPDLVDERLDWLSTDFAAKAVLDLATQSNSDNDDDKAKTTVGVFNLAQPTSAYRKTNVAMWQELFEWLKDGGLDLQLVSAQEWLDQVQKSGVDHRGLLDLWQKNFDFTITQASKIHSEPKVVVHFNCDKALTASKNFRAWQDIRVNHQLIQKIIQRWRQIGFLNSPQ